MPLPAATQPELLAPAGDWDALRAAVSNGANAVYFGLSAFNARHRATNFTLEELDKVMDYLHGHNVRGYVTVNTLIFSDELEEVTEVILGMAESGVDAVIVQDLGLAALIHRIAPALPIHASTQMTLTEEHGIDFVRKLGVERAILARELSINEIDKLRAKTEMPLEVFVHGALCVAYSGQCLTSEALGGRSANRGQCAQACRLPYEMYVDGRKRDLGERAYLLSPQDLAAHDQIEPLVKLGIQCFKIEGRLKGGPYVATTTRAYRRALDCALQGEQYQSSVEERRHLQQSFSRGFTPGFLEGVNHQELVEGRFPKSRGLKIGTVIGRTRKAIVVQSTDNELEATVKPGDGLVIDEGHPEKSEQGGRVRAVNSRGDHVEIVFGRDDVDVKSVSIGALIWKTDDPAFRKEMEQSYGRDVIVHRVGIRVEVEGEIDSALTMRAITAEQMSASVSWPGPLQRAEKRPLTEQTLHEQLDRLGDTPFALSEVSLIADEPLHVPRSVLNDLRRQLVEDLIEQRRVQSRSKVENRDALSQWRQAIEQQFPVEDNKNIQPKLTVLVRSLDQLQALLDYEPTGQLTRPAMVYCDFEDVTKYREAVRLAKASAMPIGLATLRIIKPGEAGLLKQVASQGADALLVRNLAGLTLLPQLAPETTLLGDFSLNVANELTADLLLQHGLQRLVPGYDLNWEQLSTLLGKFDPSRFEIVTHQHMPMFHMEHCVYAAFLSSGRDHRDCGRPCDVHQVDLRDRMGANFPVLVDVGCRNTVYNTLPQSAAEFIPRMVTLGVRWFRIELLRDQPETIAPLLDEYQRVIHGMESGQNIWKHLRALNQLGVTRGTLQLV